MPFNINNFFVDSENCALVLCSSYKKCRYALDNLHDRSLKGIPIIRTFINC